MEYFSRSQIISRNRRTIVRHGGNFVDPDNVFKPEPLDYMIETVQAEMFGRPIYPTVADKAALYIFSVNSNHIFHDGNKRTGLALWL